MFVFCFVVVLPETQTPQFKSYANEDTSYSRVTITVELRRKPGYYILSLALPFSIFSVLSIITFTLPPECGERVAIGQNTRTVSYHLSQVHAVLLKQHNFIHQ